MLNKTSITSLVFVLFASFIFTGCGISDVIKPKPPVGNIDGILINVNSDKPVSNFWISLGRRESAQENEGGGTSLFVQDMNDNGELKYEVKTNTSGYFIFMDVPVGKYVLVPTSGAPSFFFSKRLL
jgi:hypothetical protein